MARIKPVKKRKRKMRQLIATDPKTGFTLVNGVTLVCVVDGGSPMSDG